MVLRYKVTAHAESPSTPCVSQPSGASPTVYRRRGRGPMSTSLMQFPKLVADLDLGLIADLYGCASR
jgi:hypothetical protein